jgi:hypothetical protein
MVEEMGRQRAVPTSDSRRMRIAWRMVEWLPYCPYNLT